MADYNIPADLFYHKEHEWVKRLDDGNILIGVSDYAQKTLTDVTFVEVEPEAGDEVTADEKFGEIESVKTVSDLVSPISGEVIEVNEAFEDEPELVNNTPYEAWMIKVKPSNLDEELGKLMNADAYKTYLAEL